MAAQSVSIDALPLLRIAKNPVHSTGFLVGIDNHVTGAYPLPASAEGSVDAKSHSAYQDAMLKHLKEVNVDAQCIGWYTVTSMGNFINQHFVDTQLHYQKSAEDSKYALVFDTTRSSNSAFNLKAYSLSAAFIAAHKEGKFTTESLQKSNLRYQDILVEHPVSVHNSHLVTSYLHNAQLTNPRATNNSAEAAQSDAQSWSERSEFDEFAAQHYSPPNSLDLSIDPALERLSDLVLASLDSHSTEATNYQWYLRTHAREQAKIQAWQAKRRSDNALRAQSGLAALDADEYQRLFKLPQEPSRLETLLIGRQIEQYARQIDSITATDSSKMFAAREVL